MVIYTAFPSFESAVEAVRLGAGDYLPKPFTMEQLEQVMQRVSKARRLRNRVAELESRITSSLPQTDLTTLDSNMERVFHMGLKAAATPTTMLLLGESGTGKTVLARHLHENSPYRENRFITVSCPSLSRELLESELFGHTKGAFTGAAGETWGKVAAAEGGTLFLDEIGELPLQIQPKLLRLMQEKEYDRVGEAKPRKANVRLIVATKLVIKASGWLMCIVPMLDRDEASPSADNPDCPWDRSALPRCVEVPGCVASPGRVVEPGRPACGARSVCAGPPDCRLSCKDRCCCFPGPEGPGRATRAFLQTSCRYSRAWLRRWDDPTLVGLPGRRQRC